MMTEGAVSTTDVESATVERRAQGDQIAVFIGYLVRGETRASAPEGPPAGPSPRIRSRPAR